jgi:hypothetical protein
MLQREIQSARQPQVRRELDTTVLKVGTSGKSIQERMKVSNGKHESGTSDAYIICRTEACEVAITPNDVLTSLARLQQQSFIENEYQQAHGVTADEVLTSFKSTNRCREIVKKAWNHALSGMDLDIIRANMGGEVFEEVSLDLFRQTLPEQTQVLTGEYAHVAAKLLFFPHANETTVDGRKMFLSGTDTYSPDGIVIISEERQAKIGGIVEAKAHTWDSSWHSQYDRFSLMKQARPELFTKDAKFIALTPKIKETRRFNMQIMQYPDVESPDIVPFTPKDLKLFESELNSEFALHGREMHDATTVFDIANEMERQRTHEITNPIRKNSISKIWRSISQERFVTGDEIRINDVFEAPLSDEEVVRRNIAYDPEREDFMYGQEDIQSAPLDERELERRFDVFDAAEQEVHVITNSTKPYTRKK